MSQNNRVSVSSEADAVDVFAPTRANHERFAFLLLRLGHVPGLGLRHLDFRVALFLLAQKPGAYAAHHHTIAKACDSNKTSIRQALGRLRAAGLVVWELIPPHHPLPTGRYTRTNVNRYWVHLPRLATLLEGVAPPPATPPKLSASTRPKSRASHGTEIRSEQQRLPLSPAPSAAISAQTPEPSAGEEAIDIKDEFEPILRGWEKLGLGKVDHRSQRALENRRAEGATLEQFAAAVAGAGVDEWLRRRAKVPFAVVFASLASLERFAHAGRKRFAFQALEQRQVAEKGRREAEVEPLPAAVLHKGLKPDSGFLQLRPFIVRRPPPPATAAELARRRNEQLARLQAWTRENGLDV